MESDQIHLKYSATAPLPLPAGTTIGMSAETRVEALQVEPAENTLHARPTVARHISSPATLLRSPSRHHKRTNSILKKQVKETLDASMQYNENDDRRINQYVIKQEIGRGSFGSVHLATDQDGVDYAVKEFSKSRLRKQIKSTLLRQTPHMAAPRGGRLNVPMHRRKASDLAEEGEAANPLYLIRGEIAVMKKLNHENVINLIEVLDDPEGDSLYMVLEMCAKGVIMKVGVGESATPFAEDDCRYWFRDLMLGIEYLHAQGIIHRDIKPDNLLLNSQDVLKIVDFGVSEMFDKATEMQTKKSAGSPAFLPPEMCRTGQDKFDGKAADIWSMGVCLYCFFYGYLPFDHDSIMELYDSIQTEDVSYTSDTPPELADLFRKIFVRDPAKRIVMEELRVHPWITNHGKDKLLSAEENTADMVSPITEQELNTAITKGIQNILAAVKAISMFKKLVAKRRRERAEAATKEVEPDIVTVISNTTTSLTPPIYPELHRTKSVEADNRVPLHSDMASHGVQLDPKPFDLSELGHTLPSKDDSGIAVSDDHNTGSEPSVNVTAYSPDHESINVWQSFLRDAHIPQRHDSYEEKGERPFLDVGDGFTPEGHFITRSPAPTDIPIYESAYADDVARIKQEQGRNATVYSNKRVEDQTVKTSKWAALKAATK